MKKIFLILILRVLPFLKIKMVKIIIPSQTKLSLKKLIKDLYVVKRTKEGAGYPAKNDV